MTHMGNGLHQHNKIENRAGTDKLMEKERK